MTNVIKTPLFFYNEQIKTYILQFMAIFSNLYVQIGKHDTDNEELIPVYLAYGFKDRVVASIKGQNTQNATLRLPMMSANMMGLDLALDRMHGQGVDRRFNTLPRGGLLPNDIVTIKQRMPVPYNMMMDLSVFTSNLDEHFQIMEQLLILFNPQLSVQTDENAYDWTRIVKVELMNINNEMNYPSGPERRIIQSTLQFKVDINLAVPAELYQDYIAAIKLRVGVVSDLASSSADILAQMDQDGFEYTTIFDFDTDVNLS
jgi:hypothetical protein